MPSFGQDKGGVLTSQTFSLFMSLLSEFRRLGERARIQTARSMERRN